MTAAAQATEIVFFDAGETIVYPHPSFAELFADVCANRGYEITPRDVSAVQERLAPHLVDLAEETGIEQGVTLSDRDSRVFWTYLYRRFTSELAIEDDDLVEDLFRLFRKTSTYRLFDDVLPTLGVLERRGFRLGLISNFEGWLEKLLVELEVGHLFDVSVISGVEGVEKPDRAIYRLALERADVAPAAAVHVGDSMRLDVEPATEVGMRAVLIDRAGRYPGAPNRITSLEELPAVV